MKKSPRSTVLGPPSSRSNSPLTSETKRGLQVFRFSNYTVFCSQLKIEKIARGVLKLSRWKLHSRNYRYSNKKTRVRFHGFYFPLGGFDEWRLDDLPSSFCATCYSGCMMA